MEYEIEPSEVATLLQQAGGSYAKAYHLLVEQQEQTAIKVERTTVAQRKEQHRNAIQEHDLDRLEELQDKFDAAIDTIDENHIDLTPGRKLSHQEAVGLMQEYLDDRLLLEFLAARKKLIQEAVDIHLTADFTSRGVEDPDNQNGSIYVPELGHRFARERCGRKDPEVDLQRLEELLGQEDWEQVCDVVEVPRKIIPKHKEYSFSPEKMMRLAQEDPKALAKLLECLEVGGWRTPVITVRAIS